MGSGINKYKINCFIDCNTFLHYFLFTEIDWFEVTKSSSVLLIVNPTVLSELDKKKYDNNINLKHRAQTVIKKISAEIAEPGVISAIKKDLGFLTINKEPSIEWVTEGLSPDTPDDRIIASIIEQKVNLNNVILVTSDIGLKLKASSKKINCISLPDKYLLKDNNQNEIEKLKNKITELENKLPVLKLKILENNEPVDFIKIDITEYANELSEDEISNKIKNIEDKLQYEPPVNNKENNMGLLSAFMPFETITENEIQRYKKDLNEYIKEIPKYFNELSKYKEFRSKLIELKFVIINSGNQPAEDLIIFIDFPDGFEMIQEDDLLEEPEELKKPILPRTTREIISNINFNLDIPNYNVLSNIPNLNKSISYKPEIIKKNSYEVRYGLDKIKHGIQIGLDSVYILFESVKLAKSFKITYSILADNLPKPSRGNLIVKISQKYL